MPFSTLRGENVISKPKNPPKCLWCAYRVQYKTRWIIVVFGGLDLCDYTKTFGSETIVT